MKTSQKDLETMIAVEKLRHLSATDFAALGASDLAYVKPVIHDGQPAYAIHAADGTQMAIAPDRELALATIRQHDLEAVDVH